MSIELTTLSFNIINLSSTEKFVLTAFCYRADKNHEAYACIERLENDTALKKRTIEPALKKLRDKNILIYTGKYKGRKQNIPVYKVNLNTGNFCRDKDLTTAIFAFNTGNFCLYMTAKIAVQKDNKKDNKKDNDFSFSDLAKFTEFRGDLKARGKDYKITVSQWFQLGCPDVKDYLLQNPQN